ncbi:DNA polymerase III subunit chi [Methylobacillus arboreus]|uniref:DNA polymerase III subunit chi n=1 Tax=Methylobacillus arboreus TaxID=755170 RepID=UPI001E4F6B9B|nr:DNA polymerase III subunit chi [Methylobacillus arboreus]MCB5190251.1 DNA polymerase III subunit chi [Methylobacillus arboreus]
MTRVDFFFNVQNKAMHVASLSSRATQRGRKLMVLAPTQQAAEQLGVFLWSNPPTGFLPHCHATHPRAAETPVIIDWRHDPLPHDDILINLDSQHPPFFSRFRRLIEIVGLEEEDRAAARERYRFYRDRGYEVRTFDVSGAAL